MNIGRVFLKARQKEKITLKSMASKLGMTASALWKIEVGQSWPKPKTIEAFSQETGIPIARIYIESIEPSDY
jgi:transcriptional regulator with XRE-family HTH domain